MRRFIFALFLLVSLTPLCNADDQPMLLQSPTLSKDQIAFVFAGDLWIVGRNGGHANRLTTGSGIESHPYFSPDGSLIAFTGQYDGNTDVFVVSANGGVPQRLTYHPGEDVTVGWTPDGTKFCFDLRDTVIVIPIVCSQLLQRVDFPAKYHFREPKKAAILPMLNNSPMFHYFNGSLHGNVIAAVKRNRFGLPTLKDSSVEPLPRENSNDFNPMWIGNSVYFLSDRKGPVSLFRYDIPSKHVTQVLQNDGFDFKSASAGPGGIVYEQFGSLHLFDLSIQTPKSKLKSILKAIFRKSDLISKKLQQSHYQTRIFHPPA